MSLPAISASFSGMLLKLTRREAAALSVLVLLLGLGTLAMLVF